MEHFLYLTLCFEQSIIKLKPKLNLNQNIDQKLNQKSKLKLNPIQLI